MEAALPKMERQIAAWEGVSMRKVVLSACTRSVKWFEPTAITNFTNVFQNPVDCHTE